MKKLVALLLGTAMVATSIVGIAACNNGGGGGGSHGKVEITRRADPRDAEAYEAYDYEGTKIGAYKTIADAINATVNADLELMEDEATPAGTKGGYVIKKGGTKHLFDNKKGFADNNSDNFWYYQDGTMLTGYNCWDGTTGLSEIQNRKIIVHETTDMGTRSLQTWNGYGLLDARGQEIATSEALPNTYELASPMEAGVICALGEEKGVSGLHYKLDLSGAKITPAYEGVEDQVYAFFGFYAWQAYYVLVNGIACNTLTGEWYPFRGTSRDNSFSDIIYNVDNSKTPLMTSTWNKEGGYWVPDAKEVDMTIKTTRNVDEIDGVEFWTDELSVKFDGKNEWKLQIDDQMVNNYFTGNSVASENTYAFIAGLDVKTPKEIEDPGSPVKIENTDYFNGAKFENLVVTEAQVYFPTEDEMSSVDLGGVDIDPAWRGIWHDILMASEEYTEGTYGYTILQNYLCTTYEAKDGLDSYTFSFDHPATADTEIGGVLKDYQDKVNRLAEMTVDNINDYIEDYDEVTLWYGADDAHTGSQHILQQYLLLLDFSSYQNAQEVYRESFKLTDAGNQVLADLETLSVLTNYTYKGWTTTDEDVTGYFWSEAQKFHEIHTRYKALPESDQKAILRLFKAGEDQFNNWVDAYESVQANLDSLGEETYTIAHRDMNGKDVTYTAEQALEKLFELGYKIWMTKYEGSPEEHVFDSDDTENYKDSFHLLFLMKKMEEKEVEIPSFFMDVIYAQLTSTNRAACFAKDFNEYLYPVLTLAGEIYARQQKGEYVWLDESIAKVINTYMVGVEEFNEAGFNWNLSNNTDLRHVNTNYEHYFGLPDANRNIYETLKYIFDVVAECDPNAERTGEKNDGIGYKANVTPLAEDPTKNGSDAAKAVVSKIEKFVKLGTYDYKGWTTDAEDKTGYLYEDLKAFLAIAAEREGLTVIEQAYVNATLANTESKTNYDAWTKLSDEIAALEADAIWTKTLKGYALNNQATDYTTAQALDQLFYSVKLNKDKTLLPGSNDNLGEGEYTNYNNENIFFTATWAAMFYQYFVENNAVDLLPTQIKEGLTAAGFEKYYNEVFNVFYRTVKLANRIGAEEIEKMEDFSDDELAYLNEVWTVNYEIGSEITWNWNKGQQMQQYWQARCNRVILLAGGTLKEGDTPYLYHQYMKTIADFLEANHYTLKANGWGVTATEILDITLNEKELNLIAEFDKIGNLDTYKALGWEATGDTPIKGYLYSEAKYYEETIKALVAALSNEEKENVAAVVGVKNMNDWAELAPAILAFDKDQAALVIHAAESDHQGAAQKDYTVGESLGVLLQAIADANAVGEKFGFDSGIDKGVSFRPYYFLFELQDRKITIPQVILNRFNANKMEADAAAKFEEDLHYIITIMKIAKEIKNDAEHKLTAEEITMINTYLVGKDKFVDGGFAYAFQTDSKFTADVVSWHGNSKGYKSYFGLTEDFNVYQALVIDYLVKNYNATALKYAHASAPEDCYMGIEKPIALPAE